MDSDPLPYSSPKRVQTQSRQGSHNSSLLWGIAGHSGHSSNARQQAIQRIFEYYRCFLKSNILRCCFTHLTVQVRHTHVLHGQNEAQPGSAKIPKRAKRNSWHPSNTPSEPSVSHARIQTPGHTEKSSGWLKQQNHVAHSEPSPRKHSRPDAQKRTMLESGPLYSLIRFRPVLYPPQDDRKLCFHENTTGLVFRKKALYKITQPLERHIFVPTTQQSFQNTQKS